MSSAIDTTIKGGISLVIVAVFAIVGVGVLDSAGTTQEFNIDNQTALNDYAGTLSDVNVTSNGYVNMSSYATSGTYTSVTLSGNETNVTTYDVTTNIPNASESNITLVVAGNSYELVDGYNSVSLDAEGDSFELQFNRTSTSIETPQVDSIQGYRATGANGILGTVGVAAFGLLMLLVVVQLLSGNVGRARQQP